MAPVARPPATAEAWQISNPPILAMSPVRTSLEIFDKIGINPLRERSVRLTAFLESLLNESIADCPPGGALFSIVTPREPERRGAQLSVRIAAAADVARRLRFEHGIIVDVRMPDTVRLAPAPLYSTYHDCWRAAEAIKQVVGS
jgi:kynureninase